jgi:hypothetical protein
MRPGKRYDPQRLACPSVDLLRDQAGRCPIIQDASIEA